MTPCRHMKNRRNSSTHYATGEQNRGECSGPCKPSLHPQEQRARCRADRRLGIPWVFGDEKYLIPYNDSSAVQPQVVQKLLDTISCTFACHNMSKHVCILRSDYSLAQYLNFHLLVSSTQSARFSLGVINVFQTWDLLRRVYFLTSRRQIIPHLPVRGLDTAGVCACVFCPGTVLHRIF